MNHFSWRNPIFDVPEAQTHEKSTFSQNRSDWTSKVVFKTPAIFKIMPVRVPPVVGGTWNAPAQYIFAGPTAQRRARSSGLRSNLRTMFFHFTKIADLSLGRPHGPRSKHPRIPPMPLVAAWERPWKPPKCFLYKLQSDSWKTWFSNADLQNLMKITILPLWVTLNGLRHFTIFAMFSKFHTIEKTKKTIIITFAQGFPVFWALGLHQCTWFFHWNLIRTSLKTHLRKNVYFQNHS